MSTRLRFEIFCLLRSLTAGVVPDGWVRKEFDPLAAGDLAAEAGTNISWMLLDRFLSEMGLRRKQRDSRAWSIRSPRFALAVLAVDYARDAARGHLLFAECLRWRLCVAFFGDDVALVRGCCVVVSPLDRVDEQVLAMTSLDIRPTRDGRLAGDSGSGLPPVA